MSIYQNRCTFIERTLTILNDLESKTVFEKTLFLNTCLGLLVAPQQWDKDEQYFIQGEMNENDWFIDTKSAHPNIHKKGENALSVENFAFHLRNCLCHYLFEVLGDSERITSIQICDYTDGNRMVYSFKLKVDFERLKRFVIKYAGEKLKLLQKKG